METFIAFGTGLGVLVILYLAIVGALHGGAIPRRARRRIEDG